MSPTGQPGAGPDPNTTVQEATDWFNMYMNLSAALGAPGFAASHASLVKAMEHVKTGSMVAKVIGALVTGLADMTAGVLSGIEDIKNEGSGGINDITAAALSDLLGTKIDIAPASGTGAANQTVDNTAAGTALFRTLVDMFGGLRQITPDQGAANAQEFLGFGINFAVVTAFLGLIGGFVPFLHLEELKGIGEEVRSAIGLGRLTHTAVTPLVRNMISQPLDLWLKAQLRPDRLAEPQLVRALRSGNMQEADVRQALAEKGYPDDTIDFLLQDLTVRLALSELVLLLNNGDITEQDAINNLTLAGMTEDQAKLQLKAADLAAAKTQQDALLSELETAYVGGFIDQDTYNKVLGNLSLGDLQEQNYRAKVGFKQETSRKRVSFAQLETAIVDGIVDFSYLDTWLTQEGYDAPSQNILSFEVLQKIKTAQEKESYVQYKAAVLRKAGKPVPPWLKV
jgi:hypothetical protein